VVRTRTYLDEAERCARVVVLHPAQVPARATPAAITDAVHERAFVAEPPAGQTARGFQARLLQEPDVVDAVPEAGRVRIVRAASSGGEGLGGPPQNAKVEPGPPGVEDAFPGRRRGTAEDRARESLQVRDA